MQETSETQVLSLAQEDPLEAEIATHSSILTWRIPWTEEPGGLQSMGSQRVRLNWNNLAAAAAKELQLCLTVRPHRWQPTRILCPWDSPGKNTEVGCHFLLQCMKVKSESEVTQSCPTLNDPMDFSPPGSSIHGIFQARVLEWGAIAFSRSNLAHTYKSYHRYLSFSIWLHSIWQSLGQIENVMNNFMLINLTT